MQASLLQRQLDCLGRRVSPQQEGLRLPVGPLELPALEEHDGNLVLEGVAEGIDAM